MRKALGLLFLVACCGGAGAATPLAPGVMAPDDLGRTLAGQEIHTAALRGKVVVISFWATWCGYCIKELPILGNMQTAALNKGLPLQVVAINYKEDRNTFWKANRVLTKAVPGILLTWDRIGTLSEAFGLNGHLPTMVLLHRDGTIASTHVGYDETMLPSLIEELNRLLQESPAAAAGAPSPVADPR